MSDSNNDRIIMLESLLMHLQLDLEQLSQVVWRQQAEIDGLQAELKKLNEQLSEPSEIRDPLAEKPPHY